MLEVPIDAPEEPPVQAPVEALGEASVESQLKGPQSLHVFPCAASANKASSAPWWVRIYMCTHKVLT